MKKQFYHAILFALAFAAGAADAYAQSAIYACGHIRRTRDTAIEKLKFSGYTTAILFNVNVESDGSLTTDFSWDSQQAAEAGGIICKDGEYVFDQYQPYYADDVHSLVTQPTSINRLEICIGGWGNGSYGHIRDYINANGTGPETTLYRNFKALKEALPDVVAINNDQEQDYDVSTAVKFHKMLNEIGFKTTIAPYTYRTFWQSFVNMLNADEKICEIVYLQTYGGGAGNQPADWDVFGDLPMYIGFDCEASSSLSTMQSNFENWRNTTDVVGGFLWNYNSEARDVNEWATAINRIFETRKADQVAATFYQDINYGGYAVEMPVGEFNKAEMALYGIRANDITSFEIADGYKVTLYTGNEFDGQSKTWTAGTNWIGGDWNDKTCSMKIESTMSGVESVEQADDKALKIDVSADGDVLYVSGAKPGKVDVYSVGGSKVASAVSAADGSAKVAVGSLDGGVYVVKTAGGIAKMLKR